MKQVFHQITSYWLCGQLSLQTVAPSSPTVMFLHAKQALGLLSSHPPMQSLSQHFLLSEQTPPFGQLHLI
jgi:hypothetical protein